MSFINASLKAAYPQALSKLIAVIGNIADAEDCLQHAVEQALTHWTTAQPDHPTAWLITVAVNKYRDQFRFNQKFSYSLAEQIDTPDLDELALSQSYNDDVLRLLFTCCHPALNFATQIVLALKHVLGLSVTEIANALLITDKTVEKRLARAKLKIRHANIPYQTPKPADWHSRLQAVTQTLYLLFNEGYYSTQHTQLANPVLCLDAIRLTRMLQSSCRQQADVLALLALMLHLYARFPARLSENGNQISLANQNRQLWETKLINEANFLLTKSIKLQARSDYGLQAAIAAVHNNAANHHDTDWPQIVGLYELLIQQNDNPIIKLNALIAKHYADNKQDVLTELLALEPELQHYRHYYASTAALLLARNQRDLAKQYYLKASNMTQNDSEKQFFLAKIAECETIKQK